MVALGEKYSISFRATAGESADDPLYASRIASLILDNGVPFTR